MFVDASAMVAIMTEEPEIADIERRFGRAEDRLCSAVSLWEATRAVARKRTIPVNIAQVDIERFARDFGMRIIAIGEAEMRLAVAAHDRYGKGSGHPAQLNMGDCFAYACAKTNDAGLLYRGNDFTHTDLA